MAWYKMRREGSGGGVQPVGDATDGDVLSGKTYMNANGASTGTMTNRGAVSQTLNTTTTSYTVPEGYHNGSGTVSITTETKTITAGTSASTTSATSGKVISSVTVNPTPSSSKNVTAPASGTTTVSPDSGKLLSSVVVSPTPSQEKTTTPTTRSATAATVTPDSGKLLSKVTVNTNSVPNSNSGTKTITSSDTNWYTGNVDMGATNTYRYVNAVNVYNKGLLDGFMNPIVISARSQAVNYQAATQAAGGVFISKALIKGKYTKIKPSLGAAGYNTAFTYVLYETNSTLVLYNDTVLTVDVVRDISSIINSTTYDSIFLAFYVGNTTSSVAWSTSIWTFS